MRCDLSLNVQWGAPPVLTGCRGVPRLLQGLAWSASHIMHLPRQLSPGMAVWVVADDGTLQPACIRSVLAGVEVGGVTPFVRVS